MDMSAMAQELRLLAEASTRNTTSPFQESLNVYHKESILRNIAEKSDVARVPPKDRFHDPAFQKVSRDAETLMDRLVDVLGCIPSHSQADSLIRRLYYEAQSLAQREPPSHIVGFIGAPGSGKSSLIKSLLDFRDPIPKQSSSRSAYFSAVIEYHYHSDEGITVEVEHFSEEEMVTQLEAYLDDYRALNRDSNSPNPVCEDQVKVVGDTISFLTLLETLPANKYSIFFSPKQWVLEWFRYSVRLLRRAGMCWQRLRLTNDEFSALLKQLTSMNASTSGEATWPWIKKIRVFMNSYFLSKGLVLVDLPGLEGYHSARRNITELALMQCNELFVVCTAFRPSENQEVQRAVEHAATANPSTVSIVCTHSDVSYDYAPASPRYFPRQSNIKTKIPLLSEKQAVDPELLLRYQQEIANVLEQDDNVESHKNSIPAALKDKYSCHFPEDTLKIFCVGNDMYWKNRDSPEDADLLEYGIAMASRNQFVSATNYIHNDISRLLREIDILSQLTQGPFFEERRQDKSHTRTLIVERILRKDVYSFKLLPIVREIVSVLYSSIWQPQMSGPVSLYTGELGQPR
ncbi:hypothetical protein F5Y03DRAFT_191982 [Xylaria venustula]|nr:hypothetical protein F5Y03DRAFT_191982 [Xylaria venustula]